MRKVWTYKRKGIKGWWVGWYESSKRKAKALPTKALAEHYRQIKYTQLNSDVFTGTITVDWQQMRDEYEHSKKVAGITEDSLYEVALTLRNFERIVGKCNSKQITQNAIDNFILKTGRIRVKYSHNTWTKKGGRPTSMADLHWDCQYIPRFALLDNSPLPNPMLQSLPTSP